MSFRTKVFVECDFVWIRMSASVSLLNHSREMEGSRANLINPIVDQSYRSHGGAQLRIQLLVEGMMIKVAREGVRTFDDCFAKVSAS